MLPDGVCCSSTTIINPLSGDHSKGALIICLHLIDYGDEKCVAILVTPSPLSPCYVAVCVHRGEIGLSPTQLSDSFIFTKHQLGGKGGNNAPLIFKCVMHLNVGAFKSLERGIKMSSVRRLDRKLLFKWPPIKLKMKMVESIHSSFSL